MNIDRVRTLFAHSPVLQIFRADRGPLLIAFLFREFKKDNHSISRVQSELVRSLAEDLAESQEEAEIPSEDRLTTARRYLDEWTAKQYLLKTPDDFGNHYYELTPDSEKAIHWIGELIKQQRFVPTGSRLKDILSKIKAIVDESNADPEARINELEQQINKLQQQIHKIKETGKVETLDNTQIEEQFMEVNRLAKTMLSDFREVENNFRQIADEIYRQQSARLLTKGGLLAIALDAWEDLHNKEQGKSFYAFWRLLRSDEQTDEFNTLVSRLYELLKDRNIPLKEDRFLLYLKRNLNTHGKKVLASNDKLTEKLKRILSERSLQERQRARDLIDEIRHLAYEAINNPPDEENFMQVDTFEAEMDLPLSRGINFGEDQDIQRQHPVLEINEEQPDFGVLYEQFYVDRKALNLRIKTLLKDKSTVSLGEIIEKYPVEKGLTEIITYYAIASNDPKAQIKEEEHFEVELNKHGRIMRVPQLHFNRG